MNRKTTTLTFPLADKQCVGEGESLITQGELRDALSYCPDSGIFRWRKRNANGVLSGYVAGRLNCRSRYWTIKINQRTYMAHRLAWLYVYGDLPEVVDHINRIRDDNRIANLRAVSSSENARNHKPLSANTSGCSGVTWKARDRRWCAQISVDGKHKHLGYFKNRGDAVAARFEAEKRYGYHPNHGRDVAYG